MEDKENEKAMKVYLQALDIALRSEDSERILIKGKEAAYAV